MTKRPGRDGRPLEGVAEADLFRTAFRDDGEGMERVARGEGPADEERSARWEAALELARRALSSSSSPSDPFRTASDVFDRYRYLVADYPVEVFLVVLLDVKNRRMEEVRISTGILNGSLVHPREVFVQAVRERAASVLLVHNHPSGDPAPSPEDREVTRRLRSAGSLLGIEVVDHVIIGDGTFYSFREEADW